MFSTLVLCSIIALAFCCISLLYFYYSKLKHISYLESQLMSLKMMFANYQNSVEHKLSTILNTTSNSDTSVPNVMEVLDTNQTDNKSVPITTLNTDNTKTTTTPESHITSILNNLLSSDDLVNNGPIPIFQLVSMSSNPMFSNPNNNQEQKITASSITELNDNDGNGDDINIENDGNDINIENLDLENVDVDTDANANPANNSSSPVAELDIGEAADIDFDIEDFSNEDGNDIKTISLDSKKKETDITTTTTTLVSNNDDGVKTINLVPDVSFKLNGTLDNTLDGLMDELEELSEIASVCDDVRTVNIKTMTPADLANLSVRELKDLCTKHNIKNKKGTKNELIERLTNTMTS